MRRLTVVVMVLGLAAPARAASREIERLQVQMGLLQGQIAELQRVAEESLREVKRLNEVLATQAEAVRKSAQEQRTQDENLQAAIRELAERLGEMRERVQASASSAPYQPAPGPTGAAPEGMSTPNTAGSAPTAPPPAPRELYSQAYADYARGNYDLAVQGFQEYLRNYPNTDFSDNAQYWIGECYYGKQKYNEAIDAWNVLLRDYPSSDKLPDTRVKKGMALEKLGRRSQALVEYRFVLDRYPNSPAARIARDRLNP